MNFDFKVLAKSPPGICIVSGLACIIFSKIVNVDGLLIAVGVLLIFAGIGLQVLYLSRR